MNQRPFALFWMLILLACSLNAEADMQKMTASVGTHRFQVEVALTPAERQQGLMFRDHLASDQGMLFIQPSSGPAGFWMKNTYISLDLLYFGSDGRLLEIHANTPPCTTPNCPIYRSNSQAVKYILELNAGTTQQLGIIPGDQLRLH